MIWDVKKIWCPYFQFVFYQSSKLFNWREPELLLGAGSIRNLPKAIKEQGLDNVLVITDRVLMELELPQGFLSSLEKEGISYTVYDGVEQNPSIDNIEEARALYLEKGCRGLVAFGGGSPMDTAKAVGARLVRPKKSVEKMGGFLKVRHKLPPLFAVPTTAGTGSEATIAAVVTDRRTKHKYAINDLNLIPDVAVLDRANRGLPPAIYSSDGDGCDDHAVESYITLPWGAMRCSQMAEDAVRLIVANVEKVYKNGSDLDGRQKLLLASYMPATPLPARVLLMSTASLIPWAGFTMSPMGWPTPWSFPMCLSIMVS